MNSSHRSSTYLSYYDSDKSFEPAQYTKESVSDAEKRLSRIRSHIIWSTESSGKSDASKK